jgi:hypothetical protein
MKTVLGITFFLCLGFAGKAYTCSCVSGEGLDPKSEVRRADAIFTGIVVRGELLPNQEPSSGQDASPYVGRRFHFKVFNAFKGKVGKELEIETGLGMGDCGYPFEIGRTYLVYAFGTATRLNTSGCTRTGPLQSKLSLEDFKELDKLRKKP